MIRINPETLEIAHYESEVEGCKLLIGESHEISCDNISTVLSVRQIAALPGFTKGIRAITASPPTPEFIIYLVLRVAMTIGDSKSFGLSLSEQTTEENSTTEICRLYQESKRKRGWKGPNLQQIADRLGLSEEELRDIYSWGWGENCVTERGEVVRSDLEKQVADFLYGNRTRYQYEPNINKKYTPDFLLENGIAVGVWGVKDDPEYTQKRAQKEEWYANSAWGLVSLEPSDVTRLDAIFPIESREAGIVKYASEGLIPLRHFTSSSPSPSESEDPPRRTMETGQLTDEATRQLVLDGRPKQAVVSDFVADGLWWDDNEGFSRSHYSCK